MCIISVSTVEETTIHAKKFITALKVGFACLILLSVISLWFSIPPKLAPPLQRAHSLFSKESLNATTSKFIHHRRLLILFWNKIVGEKHPEYNLTLRDGRQCRFTNSQPELLNSSVVVFNFHQLLWTDIDPKDYVPSNHSWGQRWIFMTQETPWNALFGDRDRPILEQFGTHFNATATYLADSDIDARYGYYKKRSDRPTQDEMMRNYASNRTRQVLLIISNCDGRMDYVNKLREHIQVDIYGGCGNLSFPQECNTLQWVPCMSFMSQPYKFYIAFENSDCIDYITEKFWLNSLNYDLVPIVRGSRNNYERLAPPGSYISADNFSSPQELAAYLHLLNQNDTLYNSMFQWRLYYNFYWNPMMSQGGQGYEMFDQELCNYAHTPTKPKWYNASTIFVDTMCK